MADLLPFLPFPDEAAEEDIALTLDETTQPPDAAARTLALNIRRSFIVEAPAGSGKTGLLIQRFLKLLADESVTSPEQVLAITFTLKATAEMRDRILAHLEAANLEAAQFESTPLDLAAQAEPAASEFTLQTRALALAVLERDRQLGWQLLDHPRRLNIRTIDSVCAEIARTLPVLSGSGGHLAPTDNAAPLYREAARRTLLLLGSTDTALDPLFDPALRDLLLHRDGNLADCETLLADMLSLRDQWGSLIPLTHPQLDDAWLDANVLPRLQATLEQTICAELTTLAHIFPADVLANLSDLAAELGELDGYRGNPSPIAICAGVRRPPDAIAEHLEHWRSFAHLLIKPSKPKDWRQGFNSNHVGFEASRHQKARLKALIDRISHRDDLFDALCRASTLPPAQYPPNQWAVAKSLFRVLSRALVELQFVFADHGQCDFTELSLLARAALTTDSGPEDLAAALGARLQHLLVDEMQDTSAGQYDLIELLTASWDGHSQTVFLVGDPRQSIYLFRQARVARFLQTMRTQRLGDLPLTCLRLTANFRSQQTLVEQFNENFASIFPRVTTPEAAAEAIPYTLAEPTRSSSAHASGLNWHAKPVHIHPDQTMSPPQNSQLIGFTPAQLRQRQARRDAREIRRIARHWLTKPFPANRNLLPDGTPEPWSIAVLVRSRSHLAEIVAAFDSDDNRLGRMPYRAVDITPLNERQEILDLTALTRALLHPADRVAWLAVLHAPWCGLPLADLHTLTGADDPTFSDHSIQRLIAERGHLLCEESIQRMTRVWTVLEAASTQRARLSTSQLVERTWRSLGGDAWLKPEELINARRFLQLLDEMEAELGAPSRIDPTLLHDRLQRLYAEPSHFAEAEAHIDLTTIHGAKGLEWDVVFVPALERSPGFSRTRLLTWSELDSPGSLDPDSGAAPIMLAPIAARGEEIDPLTRWLKSIHKEREADERKRLFYVASTRAREELHLFAAPDISGAGHISVRWDSLLKAAWPAAEPHFTAAMAATATNRGGLSFVQSHRAEDGVSQEAATASSTPPEPIVLDLAASAKAVHPVLHRLPTTFEPPARFAAARARKLSYGEASGNIPEEDSSLTQIPFARPEGSFAARSFGNAVHAFLEVLATRIAAGAQPATLVAELPAWTPRIAAILRADGLPPAIVDRLTRETLAGLKNTLRDPDGLWLLAPHAGAANELALTAQGTGDDTPSSVRVDRVFRAGPEPRAPCPAASDDFLWIIDYKTTAHGPSGLEEFLENQRATYAPQLETYARVLAPANAKSRDEIRLALYYPTIPRLTWWKPLFRSTHLA